MRIIHITDSHASMKPPSSRQDTYFIACLEKMMEIAYRVRQFNADMVIHTGDLFHTSRVSDKFTGMLAEIIRKFGVPMYVIPGNHDIDGYNLSTIDQTKLGLLYKTGVVRELNRDNPLKINMPGGGTICISGQEYYSGIDEGNMNDFSMQGNDNGDLNILCIHGYIVNEQQPAEIKCTQANTIVTDADVILSGHYHKQVIYEADDYAVYNPGSMLRTEQTEYNKTHMPMFGLLDINYNGSEASYSYTLHKFKCAKPSTEVFDYNSKYAAKASTMTLDKFKNSITNTVSSIRKSSFSTQAIIDDICNNSNEVSDEDHKFVSKFYSDVFQSMPEEYVTKKGYVEAQTDKHITKVEISNFQSHSNTVIDFSNGMNIIKGESNAGKTSIFRAIMWCIDNKPLGSDFIMTGKNSCSVEITFSDGSKIKRAKSRNSSGTYKVIDMSTGTPVENEYKGFTNNVPIEVDNIHQMPIVQVSKDISTHLNVMMQLDQPFMITDSPQNRAQAIGRITGVHVIDAAIKKANSKLLANNKHVKVLKEMIEDNEKDMASRPDLNVVSEYISKANAILKYVDDEFSATRLIGSKLSELNSVESQISKLSSDIQKYCKIDSFAGVVSKINSYVKAGILYDKYLKVTNEISKCSKNIETFTKLSSLLPITSRTLIDIESVKNIKSSLRRIHECDSAIETEKSKVSLMNDISFKLTIIYSYVSISNGEVTELAKVYDKYVETLREEEKLKELIAEKENEYNKSKEKVSDFVISKDVCPYCGQPIDNDSCNKIIKFMTGE